MSAPMSFVEPAGSSATPLRLLPGQAHAGAGPADLVSVERMHLVSLTPIRHMPVLTGDVAVEVTRVLLEIAAQSGYRILSASVSPDRVDVLVELDGLHRPESVTRELKGLSSLRLMQSFPALRVRLKAHRLWE